MKTGETMVYSLRCFYCASYKPIQSYWLIGCYN